MVERMGIDHVALGSDFDGTTIPAAMKDASDLQLLVDALRDAGYDRESLEKICHGNWIRTLEATWGV
jgi:membrane dipeptidase